MHFSWILGRHIKAGAPLCFGSVLTMSAEEETSPTRPRGPELWEPETQTQSQGTCPGRNFFWEGGCARLDPPWGLLQHL